MLLVLLIILLGHCSDNVAGNDILEVNAKE